MLGTESHPGIMMLTLWNLSIAPTKRKKNEHVVFKLSLSYLEVSVQSDRLPYFLTKQRCIDHLLVFKSHFLHFDANINHSLVALGNCTDALRTCVVQLEMYEVDIRF